MLATGLILYLPVLSEAVARRNLVKNVHLFSAVAWALAIALVLVLGDRRRLADDWREIETIDADDRRWLRGRRAPQGRFNAGQKVNALLTAAFAVLFVVSGFFLWLGERDHRFLFDGTGTVHETLTLASVAPARRAPLPRGDPPLDAARAARDDARRRARGLGARAPREVGRGDGAGYNPRMAAYRYVLADVFTDTPLTGQPARRLHGRARHRRRDDAGARARDRPLGDRLRASGRAAAGTARIRIFNPAAEMPFAGHPTLGTAFVLGAPLQLGVIELETGVGIVPVVLERDESGEDRVRPHDAAGARRSSRSTPRARCSRRSASSGSTLPVELYDNGARHILVGLDVRGRRSRARRARTARRSRASAVTGVNCLRRRGARGWRSRMFWAHGGGSRDRLGGRADRVPPRAARPRSRGARRS